MVMQCHRLREKNLAWTDIFEEIPVSYCTHVVC
jgi:hypothetical protein